MRSADFDGAWLIPLGPRQRERQNAVAAFGGDAIRIDLNWQTHRPVEPAGQTLTAMHAGFFAVFNCLGAGQANRAAFHLHVEVGPADTRHLRDENELVLLAKDVQRRITAASARPRLQPIAGPECVERLLKAGQCAKWIWKQCHCSLLFAEAGSAPRGTEPNIGSVMPSR